MSVIMVRRFTARNQKLITALVSYRDPALAVRCGLPAVLG